MVMTSSVIAFWMNLCNKDASELAPSEREILDTWIYILYEEFDDS